MVTSFKYLGWVISATDDDCPSVVRNLARAKAVWRTMLHIIIREGATPWVSGLFLGRGLGDTNIRSGYLGGHPPPEQGPGGVSDPGDKTDDGTDPTEETGREVVIHIGRAPQKPEGYRATAADRYWEATGDEPRESR